MTTDNLPVSVLVPTFNDGSMLDEALDSLLQQTFTDFEVIVSDDAGSDGSVDRAEKVYRGDDRFKFYRQPVNLGMTRNWNASLSLAVGDRVAKLDGDDALYPEMLGQLVKTSQRLDADIVFCRTGYFDADLNQAGEYRGEQWMRINDIDPAEEKVAPGAFWYRLSFEDRQLWHSNAFMVTRSLLRNLNGWDERWGCASDTDLILRLLEEDIPVVHSPYLGVKYRLRENSVSDHFRRNDWLARETSAICQLSLKRQYQKGVPLCRRLRQQWYRHSANWKALKIYPIPESGSLPLVFQLELEPPPTGIRIGGFVRNFLAGIKRRLPGFSSKVTTAAT